MNHDHPADPRQQALTGALRCYYDAPRHRKLRPDCDGVAVVAYGPTTLCASCDLKRSAVGQSNDASPGPRRRARPPHRRRPGRGRRRIRTRPRRPRGPSSRRILDPDRRRPRPHPPGRATTLGTALRPMAPRTAHSASACPTDTPGTRHFQTSHNLGHNDGGQSEDMTMRHPERLTATTDHRRR